MCRFVVYTDVQLAGQLPLPAQPNVSADGGHAIPLSTADIFLCSRSDGNVERYFSGNIAHLALWSTALSPTQVTACSQRALLQGLRHPGHLGLALT